VLYLLCQDCLPKLIFLRWSERRRSRVRSFIPSADHDGCENGRQKRRTANLTRARFRFYRLSHSRNSTKASNYRPLGFFQIDSIIGPDGTQAHGMFFKLGNNPIKPGESRRVVCSFHCRPSFDAFMEAKRIYIWDGRIIGQVTLANEKNSN
jgi:hypothetical protein